VASLSSSAVRAYLADAIVRSRSRRHPGFM
jgi:hypothetical protein